MKAECYRQEAPIGRTCDYDVSAPAFRLSLQPWGHSVFRVELGIRGRVFFYCWLDGAVGLTLGSSVKPRSGWGRYSRVEYAFTC